MLLDHSRFSVPWTPSCRRLAVAQMKLVVIVLLLGILASLGSGLFFLMKDRDGSRRVLNALTIRIALSVALFLFLFIAWYAGWIEPHGVTSR